MTNTKSPKKMTVEHQPVPNISALSLIFRSLTESESVVALAADQKVSIEDVGAEQCKQIGRQMVQNILTDRSRMDEPNASAIKFADLFMTENNGEFAIDQKKVDACTEALCDQAVAFITGYMKVFPREMLSVKDLARRVSEAIQSGGLISSTPQEEESYIITYEMNGKTETRNWSGKGRHGKVIGDILNLGEFADFEGNPRDLIKANGEVSGVDDQYGHWSVKLAKGTQQRLA